MTLLSAIARQALIKINVQNPRFAVDSVQTAQVLDEIQNFILEHPALGFAGDFTDRDVSGGLDSDTTAKEFERLRVLDGTTSDITLPERVDVRDAQDAYDGGSSGSTTRPPTNGARVIILGADNLGAIVNELWMYVTSRGAWVQLDGLALTDEQPLGPDMDGALVAIAAYRVAGNFSKSPSPMLAEAYRMAMGRISRAFDDQGQTNQTYY